MIKFKEGQTYVCTKANKPWWTEGKEYPVVLDNYGRPSILDNDGDMWSSNAIYTFNHDFKLKEESQTPKFDLNKLTHEELRIYCNLVENMTDAQNNLDEFIKTHTK